MVNSTNRDEYIALLYISLDKGSNIIAPQVSSKWFKTSDTAFTKSSLMIYFQSLTLKS